ncbi:ArsR/SmtB family transcription factor [Aminobacter sp. HY435]|uniref:ArsR/SmtB family transcription factor n=1 Tax=Aminobacter sp. HY435 TaxID=2970917 RepID=UPI0022B9B79A|nr:metalloregulator ArsR/SmtB family transcription factor [Aminobacter sp. HY435]
MTYDYSQITALADPTRRTIFQQVAARPCSVAELTRGLPVSQSAVSQHLKVLKEAQLVRLEPRGARNIYHLDPAGLGRMRAWLDQFWGDALDEFKSQADRLDADKENET